MRIESRAVKKLLLLGVGSALMFTMGGVGPAQADTSGTWHKSSAFAENTIGGAITTAGGRCASCHRAHTAVAEKLLKQAQPALCYSCHDGTLASTNVRDGNDGGTGGLRGGGFLNARIDSGNASKTTGLIDPITGRIATSAQTIPALAVGAAVTSKHNVGGTLADAGTVWGNGAIGSGLGKSITLECGSCHDPHGNGNYRILRPVPVDSGVAATAGIKIPDATTKMYTTTNYWLTGDGTSPAGVATSVAYTNGTSPIGTGLAAPDGYIQNVAAWCTTCHTRYLATTKSYETPSGDTSFMYRHRSDANYKQGAANCITCHVSHGSNAVAGGGLTPGNVDAGADSRLLRVNNRGTCSLCHNV